MALIMLKLADIHIFVLIELVATPLPAIFLPLTLIDTQNQVVWDRVL